MTASPILRNSLIRFTLASVGLPVAVIGVAAWFVMSYRLDVITQQVETTRPTLIEGIEGRHLVGQARRTADTIDNYVVERISDARIWAGDPLVVTAVRSGAAIHESRGLVGLDPETVEARFPSDKSLHAFPETDERLRALILASPHFAEVFVTDIHGLNVSTTNPTSDVLQSDEGWWLQAWETGIDIGDVEYDDSAGIWSIALSMRIADTENGRPIGVMKAVLSLDAIQAAADRTAETLREDGNVQIVDDEGRLIAETLSGHSQDRLMNDEVGVEDEASAAVLAGARANGLVSAENVLTAFSRTSSGTVYEPVARAFGGLGWTVLLHEPTAQSESDLLVFDQIVTALRQWRIMLAVVLAGTLVACLLTAAGIAAGRQRGGGPEA